MSDFYEALKGVLLHEGGFINHGADKGGATDFGISLRFLQSLPASAGDVNGDGHVDIQDIRSLTEQSAGAFYKTYFWDHYRIDEIRDQRVAQKLFNFFVNMRGKTAGLIAQRAANDLGAGLVEDGLMGSKSIAAINQLEPLQMVCCIRWRAWEVYKLIIEHDSSQAVFKNGWRRRAFS